MILWLTDADALLYNVADSYSVPSWVIGTSKTVFINGAVIASIVMSTKNPRIIPTIKISEIADFMGKPSRFHYDDAACLTTGFGITALFVAIDRLLTWLLIVGIWELITCFFLLLRALEKKEQHKWLEEIQREEFEMEQFQQEFMQQQHEVEQLQIQLQQDEDRRQGRGRRVG